MENGSLEVQRFARFAYSLFSRAKCTEVFNSLGNGVSEKTHDDTALAYASNFNVKVNPVGYGFTVRRYRQRAGIRQ